MGGLFREDAYCFLNGYLPHCFFSSVMINGLEMDGWKFGARACLEVDLKRWPSISDSRAASKISSGSCTSSLLSSAWRQVDENDGLPQFCIMRSGLLVIAASSGLDTCNHVLRLSWLWDIFSEFSRLGPGLEAWLPYGCALRELKTVESSSINAFQAISMLETTERRLFSRVFLSQNEQSWRMR